MNLSPEVGVENPPRFEGITVLVPTYNRCDVLRTTLEAIARSDLSGIELEIIAIDNNSSDGTLECIREFRKKLPLVYVKEPRPGKNCALNKALRECRLGSLVVMIDDDITPAPDWLREIQAASRRWPAVSVFGAKVEVGWPDGRQPDWVVAEWVKVFGFAWHDLGERERLYTGAVTPMGPCYWVRREVFSKIHELDETIGPRPRNRIMGSEVSFFLQLEKAGYEMVYCPKVEVKHRIQHADCTLAALKRRAYRCGRGEIRLYGVHRKDLLDARGRQLWRLVMMADLLAYSGTRLIASYLVPSRRWASELALRAMGRAGRIMESWRLVFGKAR